MSHGTARWCAAPARFPRMRRTSEMPAAMPTARSAGGSIDWRRRVATHRGVELSKGAAAALGVRGRRHGQCGGGRGGRDGGGAGGRVGAAPVALEAD